MEKEKKYCTNCIYFDNEYSRTKKIVCQKDTPIERVNVYCDPNVHNKNNDCEYYEDDFHIITNIKRWFKK